ncbi:uncharacterized protein LOC100572837 isoform X2 [Acyrthosiphon pisum]|uniref:Uncharacterized protein n=1 Tax=Acyrthosiphon pisum TaxID=7029 RepID=A0A8R2H6U7_ACYPI|nr:uncharacterized protein LOC100572837 isoform X2 [Acyrthosiphon pisum]|eukprot:XP_016660700.1 PREDICTED: uncharacterized protein LOC100572837 isoform X2 [Acyrthosiphon pisum]
MFKHIIIVLALCFMAYIVGNIDATTDRQRFNQFNDLVKCYKQLFEHELVKRNVARQSAKSSDTFKDIIKGFYAWYNIKTTVEKGTGELQPRYIMMIALQVIKILNILKNYSIPLKQCRRFVMNTAKLLSLKIGVKKYTIVVQKRYLNNFFLESIKWQSIRKSHRYLRQRKICCSIFYVLFNDINK